MKRLLDAVSRKLDHLGAILGCTAIMIMTWMIAQNVFMRYFLNKPSELVEEYSGFLFVFLVFMGLGYVTRKDLHISVELVFRRFSEKVRKYISLITMALNTIVVLVYLVFSIRVLVQGFKTGESSVVTLTPLWLPKIFMCAGLAIFLLATINRLVNIAASMKEPSPPVIEPDAE
jgi:TRAP-type C4-dicarboxylate transport system permease small subunit